MTIKLVGAGLGRTGTMSLKNALETLLGGRCYHMMEVFGRPDDMNVWRRAAEGDMPDWPAFLGEFSAIVDWPGAAFWSEMADAFPDAPVLLSTRSSAESWWKSANDTIFEVSRRGIEPNPEWKAMHEALFHNRFTPQWTDEAAAKAAYEAHNEAVRAAVPAARLVEWQPGDGWEPLCEALKVPVPDEPFPHVNTTTDFRAMTGMDAPSS